MRWRLLAAVLGVMAVMLVAQDVPLAAHLRRVERDRQVTDLERDAFIIAGQASSVMRALAEPSSPDDAVDLTVAALSGTIESYARAGERGVVVVDGGATVVAAAGADPPAVGASLATEPDIVAALERRSAAGDEPGVVSVAVPVLEGADAVGAVRVSSPETVIDERASRRVRGLVWVAAISLGAAALVALFVSATVTGPLRRLQRSTERVAGGDYDTRVDEASGPPEVRRLARSFNAMTEQVATAAEQSRAFAGDASHQLRTPLTALRLQIERTTALVEGDPAGALRNLEAAGDEIARLQRMIDGLLVLARSTTADHRATTTVAVHDIVGERVAVWAPLAEERGVEITVWAPDPVLAAAIPGALDQILDNYLDNAIAVAPAGTTVEVVVDAAGSASRPSVSVHVLDRGPGLTDEQLAAAFGRFWRAPGNRHDGSGLGLAIVAHLAESCGATASLARRPGGGLDASVLLRRARTPRPDGTAGETGAAGASADVDQSSVDQSSSPPRP